MMVCGVGKSNTVLTQQRKEGRRKNDSFTAVVDDELCWTVSFRRYKVRSLSTVVCTHAEVLVAETRIDREVRSNTPDIFPIDTQVRTARVLLRDRGILNLIGTAD